jgi:hypothetical protein
LVEERRTAEPFSTEGMFIFQLIQPDELAVAPCPWA